VRDILATGSTFPLSEATELSRVRIAWLFFCHSDSETGPDCSTPFPVSAGQRIASSPVMGGVFSDATMALWQRLGAQSELKQGPSNAGQKTAPGCLGMAGMLPPHRHTLA